MKRKLAKLIDVKSIVTLITTLVFSYLSVTGKITGEQFLTVFTMVMAFYFGTQSAKANDIQEEPAATLGFIAPAEEEDHE